MTEYSERKICEESCNECKIYFRCHNTWKTPERGRNSLIVGILSTGLMAFGITIGMLLIFYMFPL